VTPRAAHPLLTEILGARDRDDCPGANRLVALREGDDALYLAYLHAQALRTLPLRRFGRELLSVAEFAPSPRAAATALRASFERRWRAARPIVLPGWASDLLELAKPSTPALTRLCRNLRTPRTLKRFLNAQVAGLELEPHAKLDDPERDLEKYAVVGGRGMWIKSATLSSPASNSSGRVRFSFGAEGDDDASTDEAAHALVAKLARRCLPLADQLARSRPHAAQLARFIGGPALLTQQILYWNAPEGGALLHHDAFHESARTRQRGVCYVQQTGATIWLALSTRDLAARTREFLDALTEGAAPWVIDDWFDGARAFAKLARRASDAKWLERELVAPGCGAFARLVNYSPEYLGLLIDAGHAWRLGPGDAILLPNFGHHRTCHHAVWCASKTPGLALSMAIRRRSQS
jgi:hypothetical protein